jgi:polar amino acid transport system substrate-binding protein
MSYGPGRYDPEYEERGHDYPLPYVRWTEGRNIEAFLDLVASGGVRTAPLVTHRFRIEEGARAYELIAGDTGEPHLGVLLTYDAAREIARAVERRAGAVTETGREGAKAGSVRIGLVGAGGYARGVLLPQFRAAGAEFVSVATASGVSAKDVGERYDFARLAAAGSDVIDDPEVNLVVVATRHDTHAELARRALEVGKHVFVEKPLALNDEELDAVVTAARASAGTLAVGYNRRFSPLALAAREFFSDRREPLSILYRVNAGRVPRTHWTQDAREGGGRIVGEVCHFVDLMQFWTQARPVRVHAESVAGGSRAAVDEDSVFVTLRFADGSNGCVAYLAEGDRALPKERIEIFGTGRSYVIDDFRAAHAYRDGREEKTKLRAQDKGQAAEARAICNAVLDGAHAPVPLEELEATTRATFRILDSLRTGRPVGLDERPGRGDA